MFQSLQPEENDAPHSAKPTPCSLHLCLTILLLHPHSTSAATPSCTSAPAPLHWVTFVFDCKIFHILYKRAQISMILWLNGGHINSTSFLRIRSNTQWVHEVYLTTELMSVCTIHCFEVILCSKWQVTEFHQILQTELCHYTPYVLWEVWGTHSGPEEFLVEDSTEDIEA